MNKATTELVVLIGRVLLALLFLDAGYGKIGGFAGTVGYIGSKGLPMPEVLAAAALTVELVAGILLVIGWKARWAALALGLFALATSFLFHNYWTMPEAQQTLQKIMFLKNLAIAGGMLTVFAYGPGGFSVDRR
jgi:putative oxidoreductase